MLRTLTIVVILFAAFLGIVYILYPSSVNADGYVQRTAYRQHKTRLYRQLDDDSGGPQKAHCLGPVRGVGTQWVGEQGALDTAKKDWMERVRFDHGETFLDLSHAEGFEKRCGRTSIGEVAGQVLYRCEVVARPCKAEFEKQEGQK